MNYVYNISFLRYRLASFSSGKVGRITRSFLLLLMVLVAAGTGHGQFLQVHRINALNLQFTTDSFAPSNAIGTSIGSAARSSIQGLISTEISTGSISLLFEMPGLTDLTGTNQASMQIGVVNAVPVIQAGNPATYSGTSDLDWWYKPNAGELDGNGVPKNQVSGSITSSVLQAGPGPVTMVPNPISQTGQLAMSGVDFMANIGSSSHPLISSNGYPPGHLPSENIDTALVSFASMGGGGIKGNVSAASLANTPVPSILFSTDQGYTASNSMLDVFVGGATTLSGLVRIISAVQPDQSDPGMPVAGAGPPYTFFADPTTKAVDVCVDKNNDTVDLTTALNSAAYSVYFTFTTDRVIAVPPPSITLSLSSQWNLLSVPLVVGNFATHSVFPAAVSGAFAYEGGYVQKDTLSYGIGYWLRFPAPASDKLIGDSITTDNIPVSAGWNLIGSISAPIAVTTIQSNPPGLITSNFFGYSGGYVISDSIRPGEGYWVKVTGTGSLVLNAYTQASAMKSAATGRIRIIPTSELPPPPPGDVTSDAKLQTPHTYALGENFPNPFNPSTTIGYELPEDSRVTLTVTNILGQVVQILHDGIDPAGYRHVEWNASHIASGLYFYRLEAVSVTDPGRIFVGVKKMLLLK